MVPRQDPAKQRILAAATDCFAKHGYSHTSIRQICEAADANLALVSYHYGSKEKLYYAVIERYRLNLTYDWPSPLDRPHEALQHFIRSFVRLRATDMQFRMLLRHELALDNPRREVIREVILPYFQHLRDILAAGHNSGDLRIHNLDHTLQQLTSILVYPACNSLLLEQVTADELSPDALEEEIEQTIEFILTGLAPLDSDA